MFRLGNARYHGDWKNRQDVFEGFFPQWDTDNQCPLEASSFPEDSCILFASYDSWGSYDGDALVLFMSKGKLMVVESYHCSCNGLEWEPDAVSWLQLHQSYNLPECHSGAARAAFLALVGHNVTRVVQVIGEDGDEMTVTSNPSGPGKRFVLVPQEYIEQKQLEEG